MHVYACTGDVCVCVILSNGREKKLESLLNLGILKYVYGLFTGDFKKK